ncbi:hypothetical protein F5884DRAFT_686724 [Xylogone sp. PMI_703]|nr:hypothetical protein F5884DRAFT_686724 [Xylogone sp. PMI_703]
MGNMLSQTFAIPKPSLTEKNIPDQIGKVFIITGGNTGVGYEVCRILFMHHGTVYLAGRSKEKCEKAIASIRSANPGSNGKITFLKLDLGDLSTIKGSAQEFMSKETGLHWLCNNAGVMVPPEGSKTVQGYDLQIGTNCLGPWLFTHFLHPILRATAASNPPNSVRVSWAGSLAIDAHAPEGGMPFDASGNPDFSRMSVPKVYGASKAGNLFYAAEYGRRAADAGIVSTCFNPGNLRTEIQRHTPGWQDAILSVITYPAVFGAYTELWSGLSPDLTTQHNGSYIGPWGRVMRVKKDRAESLESISEGGTGKAAAFWDWSERECLRFM